MYLCVNLFGTNVRGNAARGTWQTVELSIPSLVATCSSCACDFDLEPGSGSSILPPGYAKILRRCINANNYNKSSNKRDKSSAMSFANSSGILAAAAHWIFCSFCPSCPFFGQHCRRVTFEDLLQLWRQLWLRYRPMLCLRCALCGFLLHFMCYLLSQQ